MTMTKSEIVKVNPQEFGLTDETAKNIKSQFMPMLDKMVELEERYNEIVCLPIEDPNTSKLAKELRKEYVTVRKKTEEIHKVQKAFYLNGGRYVDGWKNAQAFSSQYKEEELKKIENYFENLEKQRKEELVQKRLVALSQYVPDLNSINKESIAVMDDDVFNVYLGVKKKAHEEIIEAEKIAQKEKELAQKIEDLRNSRLKNLYDNGLYSYMTTEQKEMNLGVMSDKYYNGLLIDLKNRKEQHEKEQQKLREENEAMRKQQAEAEAERQRLTQELQKKEKEVREAQRLKELEEEKARKEAQKLAKAPIKKQLNSWVDSFDLPQHNGKDHELVVEIQAKFNSFKKWAKQQIENI